MHSQMGVVNVVGCIIMCIVFIQMNKQTSQEQAYVLGAFHLMMDIQLHLTVNVFLN